MEEVHICFHPCACVHLSVCVQDYSKMRAWIWMKCCVSTDVGTWTNWLTFEPDLDHSPDAGTGFLSPIAYALQCGNMEFYYARNGIGGPAKQRHVVLRCQNTAVRGKYALLSPLLVLSLFLVSLCSVTDISATVTSICVKFCKMLHIGPGHRQLYPTS